MAAAAHSIEAIIARFEPAPHVSNPPLYEEISELRKVIQRNATKIRTNRGGGRHGHLAITMTTAEYATIAPGTPFDEPQAPALTLNIPAGTSQVQAANMTSNYKMASAEFALFNNVNDALKQQIQEAVPHEYLDDIRDEYTGLSDHSINDIFDHLFDQPSGVVTDEDVEARRQSIEEQKYSLEEELAIYYKRLQDFKTYAAQGDETISDANLMNMAIRHLRATGHFHKAIRDWKDKQAAQKTWANFKTHFNKARKQAQQEAAHTSGSTFQAANQVLIEQLEAKMSSKMDAIQQENQKTLNEVAAQVQHVVHKVPVQPLQPHAAYNIQGAPPTLPAYFPQSFPPPPYHMYGANGQSKEVSELKAMVEQLTAKLADQTTKKRGRGRSGGTKYDPNRQRTKRLYNNENYCWTHGWDCDKDHTSATCKNQATGHQVTATRSNTMGGSDKHKSLVT